MTDTRTLIRTVRGAHKRDLIAAVYELARRAYEAHGSLPKATLSNPRQAYQEVKNMGALKKEQLLGLYLDAQNGLIAKEVISVGSLNTTRTHPREIFYPAVMHVAMGVLLVHNHPSGCVEPSAEDIEFTNAVKRAGEVLGIELFDHLIIVRGGYTSLRERGLI